MPNLSDSERLLRDFSRALPLNSPREEKSLGEKYVNRSSDMHDPVDNLRQALRDEQEEDNGCYLFSGMRGSGKTTELKRLVDELRNQDQIRAYYCDASEYLNLNDPQFGPTDIVMVALAGLSDAARREHGENCLGDLSFWKKTVDIIKSKWNDITIRPALTVSSPIVGSLTIEASLKENPDFRKKLAEFASASSAFYDTAAEYTKELTTKIQQIEPVFPSRKIVLVIDSMECFTAAIGDETRLFNSLTETFFDQAARLRFPSLSVIYSVPPYLRTLLPGVRNGFSGYETLANFKVIDNDKECSPNPKGVAQMTEIITHRFPDWGKILKIPVLKHLAWASGGNVRFFFGLLRDVTRFAAVSKKALPIKTVKDKVIDAALKNVASDWQWLNASDRRWLNHFMSTADPFAQLGNAATDLPSLIRLFNHSLILNYQNGDPWYGLSPLLHDYMRRNATPSA